MAFVPAEEGYAGMGAECTDDGRVAGNVFNPGSVFSISELSKSPKLTSIFQLSQPNYAAWFPTR
jgi:hypothetical protein